MQTENKCKLQKNLHPDLQNVPFPQHKPTSRSAVAAELTGWKTGRPSNSCSAAVILGASQRGVSILYFLTPKLTASTVSRSHAADRAEDV